MKKSDRLFGWIGIAAILGLVCSLTYPLIVRLAFAACSNTTNLSLCKPALGDPGWGTSLNTNFDLIDANVALKANNLSVFAATTSAQLIDVLSDETGTLLAVFSDKPVFTTDITSPIVYGGSAVGSTLTLAGTSNGAPVNAHVILNGTGQGNVGIGTTGPLALLHVAGANQATGGAYNTYGNLFISSTDALAADKGGAISFGGTGNISAVLTYTFARITGKKEVASAGNSAGYLAFETDDNVSTTLKEYMRITSTGNVGIGTTTLPGSGTPGLVFGQGTAFGTMGSNTAGIQAKDVAGTAEMFAVDEAGVATQISPHPSDVLARVPVGPGPLAFPWAYTSENPYLGKRIDVQLAMFVADYEKRFGVSFTTISDLPPSAKKDWRTEKTKTAQETYEKQIQTEMQKESEVIDIALVWETVEVLEEIDDPTNPRVFFVVNPETRTIQEKREPGKKSIGTGKFIYQLKPNHHVDAATGKVFRKKTQAEAEAAISQVVVKAPPKWLSDRGVTF